MTVCVGAINASGDIVTASDRMLTMSHGAFAGDSAADKTDVLCNNWLVMYAAEDVGVIPRLLRRARYRLIEVEGEPSVDEIMEVLRESFQIERRERAAELYLSSYGVDLQQFLVNGDTLLGQNLAAIVRDRLERHELGCELLAVGHTDMADKDLVQAHVLYVHDPGSVKDVSVPGYWAIGSGSYLALSTLVGREQNIRRPLEATIYNVCEAKFAAESASGVGKRTFVTIHRSNGSWTALGAKALARLRSTWEQIGRPRPASSAHRYLTSWLTDAVWSDPDSAGAQSDNATSSDSDQT